MKKPHMEVITEMNIRPGRKAVLDVISQEAVKVRSGKIILGGINQGGAMAMYILAHMNWRRLGGYIGINTWMFKPDKITGMPEGTGHYWTPRTLLMHNDDEPDVDHKYGEELHDSLNRVHTEVWDETTWHLLEGGGRCINEPQGVQIFLDFMDELIEERKIYEKERRMVKYGPNSDSSSDKVNSD